VQFDSLAEVFSMGGHGGYVWFVYAVALVLVLMLLVGPVLRGRRIRRQLLGQMRRQQALRDREDSLAPGT
jgi:heme exporter protein D